MTTTPQLVSHKVDFTKERAVSDNSRERTERERSKSGGREMMEPEDTNISTIASKIQAKSAYVWAFGGNKDGELGIGHQRDALLPRPIAGMLKDG